MKKKTLSKHYLEFPKSRVQLFSIIEDQIKNIHLNDT
jgi:hypothetical protein